MRNYKRHKIGENKTTVPDCLFAPDLNSAAGFTACRAEVGHDVDKELGFVCTLFPLVEAQKANARLEIPPNYSMNHFA